ncbi:hypothetical protein, partial [Exiguobacterium oxidotolerans]
KVMRSVKSVKNTHNIRIRIFGRGLRLYDDINKPYKNIRRSLIMNLKNKLMLCIGAAAISLSTVSLNTATTNVDQIAKKDLPYEYVVKPLAKQDLPYEYAVKTLAKQDLPYEYAVKTLAKQDLPYEYAVKTLAKQDLPYEYVVRNEA